ncbi:MAG: hypothetical protein PF508_02970 [Spirochaeta sp.]|jgi:hypothetical protein|nr:hypothetical protein [Spirochaeta sp.]
MKDTAALFVVSILTILTGIALGLHPVNLVPGLIGLVLATRGQSRART